MFLDDTFKSMVLILPLLLVPFFLEGCSKFKDTLSKSESLKERFWTKPKMWGSPGHSWLYKISLNATHIRLRATTAPLVLHKVFTAATAATHYQRMNITPVWMPLHELIAHKVTASTGLDQNCEMEPLNASNETIPFFPNLLLKLGHQIKDKQLQRPKSDKIVHKEYYASSGQWHGSFFIFLWILWSQGRRNVIYDMSYYLWCG